MNHQYGTPPGMARRCYDRRHMPLELPCFDDVVRAGQALLGHATHTPVLRSRSLDERLGAHVYFKCENFQRAGAFKFRGAFFAISQLRCAQRQAGVVTFSSGNHAQAVALAARMLQVPATVVMPLDAPQAKMAATRAYGAHIVHYDRHTQDREQMARDLAHRHGLTLIPPFDHPDIIAGQGTAARELFDEVGPLDALFVPLGGGGLLSGSLVAAQALAPSCAVYGVEPEAGDDGRQSLRSGSRVAIAQPDSIADGALTRQLGVLTFELIRRHVRDIRVAGDAALCQAMQFFAERMKIVVEPTGALGAAALFEQVPSMRGRRVGVIISGGNVDMATYARCLAAGG